MSGNRASIRNHSSGKVRQQAQSKPAEQMDIKAFRLQQDQLLRKLVLDAWAAHPGMIACKTAQATQNTENFLKNQKYIQENKDYYRLSPGQKRWMISIAQDLLRITLPEEIFYE